MLLEFLYKKIFYNKNILEYAKIAQSGPKSLIRDIGGFSNI